MRIAAARVTAFALPLRRPLATGSGVVRERRGVLIALETADGAPGFGEATPPFGNDEVALERVYADVERLGAALVEHGADVLLDAADPAARFALETAVLDARARTRGVPLADLLAGSVAPRRRVLVNALLAEEEPDAAAAEARDAVARGFRTLKLKVAAASPARDRARLSAVRAAVGPAIALRIDANGAWRASEAIAALARFEDLALELVEQPVAADDVAGLARVHAASLTPVAADEAIASAASAERVLANRAADLLVLKPGVLGGLALSLALARRARTTGVGAFVTSGLDGAIARAAALALAATLSDPLPACGLATGGLLAEDLAEGLEPKDGALELHGAPGLGLGPDPAALAALALRPTREFTAR